MATRAVAVKNADRKTTIKEYPPLIPSQKRWDFYSILFAKYFPICKKISILVEVKMKNFYRETGFIGTTSKEVMTTVNFPGRYW